MVVRVLGSSATCGVMVTSIVRGGLTVSGINCPLSFRYMRNVALLTVSGFSGLLKIIFRTMLVPTVVL